MTRAKHKKYVYRKVRNLCLRMRDAIDYVDRRIGLIWRFFPEKKIILEMPCLFQ